MGRAVNLQLWDENLQLWDFYHAFPRKLQMVLSVCLQQLVTSNVQLSLLPLSVKRLGSGVSASKSEVAVLSQNGGGSLFRSEGSSWIR